MPYYEGYEERQRLKQIERDAVAYAFNIKRYRPELYKDIIRDKKRYDKRSVKAFIWGLVYLILSLIIGIFISVPTDNLTGYIMTTIIAFGGFVAIVIWGCYSSGRKWIKYYLWYTRNRNRGHLDLQECLDLFDVHIQI